jgi:hypothetical protein
MPLYRRSSGVWLPFTSTTTNVTLGDGTLTCRYRYTPDRVDFTIRLAFGSTTAITGQPSFTVPVAIHSEMSDRSTVHTVCADATGGVNHGHVGFGSSTLLVPFVSNAASSYVADANISGTVPFTWAVNDYLAVLGWYRPA